MGRLLHWRKGELYIQAMPAPAKTSADYPLSKRPLWLIGVVVLLLLFQIGAIINALQIPADLAKTLSLSPIIQVIAGVFWVLVFARVAFTLSKRTPTAVNRAFCWLMVFIIYSVLRLLSFAQSDYDRRRWPILILVWFSGTSLIALIACTRRKKWQRRHN